MSDLASQLALTRTPTASAAFVVFRPEGGGNRAEAPLRPRPRLRRPRAMAPEPGNYRVLDWRENGAGWALVNNDGRHDLVSNVCRHRQAVMLKGAGKLPGGTITCPIHRWTYDSEGKHIGAPHFPDQPCLDLPRQGLQQWNGMLFNGKRDIARDLARHGRGEGPRLRGLPARQGRRRRLRLQLEDLHRGLPRGLPRRPLPPGPGPLRHLRRPQVGVRRLVQRADGGHQQRARQAGQRGVHQVARAGAQVPQRRAAAARRDLAHLLPERDGRVVPARAGDLHALPDGPGEVPQRGGVLLPRGDRPLRARVRGGRAEGLPRDRGRGRGDLRPHDRGPAHRSGRRGARSTGRTSPPMEDGMVHFHEFVRRELVQHL